VNAPFLEGSERGHVIAALRNTAGALSLMAETVEHMSDDEVKRDLDTAWRRLVELAKGLETVKPPTL
jgi:hypothetical protein